MALTTTSSDAPSRWFLQFRRVVVFLLGVAVIIDALTDSSQALGKSIVGLFMIGVLPLDDLVASFERYRAKRDRRDDERR